MNAQEIAQVIIQQLGHSQNRLRMMIGAKQFAVGEDLGNVYVGIKFSAKAANKSNYVKIALLPSDTYSVEFMSIRGFNCNSKGKFEGVYADQLKSLFESETGLYLSL